MVDYRLYWLDGARRIAGAADIVSAADDDDAIAQARSAARASRCELWQGRRLVGTVQVNTPEER